jgi:hypothetical protein
MTEKWFDAIITPAEQVEVSIAKAKIAWSVEQFRVWVTQVMPTEVANISPFNA